MMTRYYDNSTDVATDRSKIFKLSELFSFLIPKEQRNIEDIVGCEAGRVVGWDRRAKQRCAK